MTPVTGFAADLRERAESPPRKVVVASALVSLRGSLEQRLDEIVTLVAGATDMSRQRHDGKGLDLMVFPEFAVERATAADAAERAVTLDGAVAEKLSDCARVHRTWLVVPMTLREPEAENRISNAAVLFNREGGVAGIFRKVRPVSDKSGVFEGGVTPGESYPVFQCDFGRLGILICWDMAYEDAWSALAKGGAEIVALPSASPQTLRPMAAALRHHYHVLTSTPRDNASLFDPIGQTAEQITSEGVLVAEIDLAYAIVHWSENLRGGAALAERFGAAVGFRYSNREDTGVFWSNDPARPIGTMLRELGLEQMPAMVDRVDAARRAR